VVVCAPSAPPSVATFPSEELKNIKNSKGDPGQMATISECRCPS
jgi:hypothetical protein